MRIVLAAALCIAGCAVRPEPSELPLSAATEASLAPRGAKLGPDGFATVADAPPAPFDPASPPEPPPPTADQVAGQAQFARAGTFQNEVRDIVTALDRRLRVAERGNYVGPYFDNEGTPTAVFQFLRDGPGTLAKYTRNPRFVGKTARFSRAQLLAAMRTMQDLFASDRVLDGIGIGRNSVDARISVTEAEFRALVATKGATLPDGVDLEYTVTTPASVLNAPLPPEIARLVKVFARDDRPNGILNSINSTAKVTLRDGCFHVAESDALALFPLGEKLFVDREGYLAFGEQRPGYARVGETLIFPGSLDELTAPELVDPIRRACGPGKVVKITGTRSAAADRAQSAVSETAFVFRELRQSYGLSEGGARAAIEACKLQSGTGFCPRTNPPPPPVGASQARCPPDTRISYGLCRTPQGYIRPLPTWLEPFKDL